MWRSWPMKGGCLPARCCPTACNWWTPCRKGTRWPCRIWPKATPWCATTWWLALPPRPCRAEAGSTSASPPCPPRAPWKTCPWARASHRCRRWKATRSRATATPTAPWARAISWPSAPRCNACRAWSNTPWRASARNCCRAIPTWTTWSASSTPTAAAWPLMPPARPSPSAPCTTSPSTPTLAARPWWSAWVAKSCNPNGCWRRAPFRSARARAWAPRAKAWTPSCCKTKRTWAFSR
ncbi:hypothetical protein D3C73_977470 [compost metagenome]